MKTDGWFPPGKLNDPVAAFWQANMNSCAQLTSSHLPVVFFILTQSCPDMWFGWLVFQFSYVQSSPLIQLKVSLSDKSLAPHQTSTSFSRLKRIDCTEALVTAAKSPPRFWHSVRASAQVRFCVWILKHWPCVYSHPASHVGARNNFKIFGIHVNVIIKEFVKSLKLVLQKKFDCWEK